MSFKVGDRVVCVRERTSHINKSQLIKGREYIVYQVVKACCFEMIDVGIISDRKYSCDCGGYEVGPGQTVLFNATRFRKIEEKKEVQYVKLEVEIEEPCYN